MLVEGLDLLLPASAVADVVVGLEDGHRPLVRVAAQRQAAGQRHLRSVGPGLVQLAFPAARPEQLGPDLLGRDREHRPQELVRALADRLLGRVAEQLLGALVPVGDHVVHVAHEDGVVREIEQAGLLRSFRHFPFQGAARVAQLALDAASVRAEDGDHEREDQEGEEDRPLGLDEVERVQRLDEEIVEAQPGEDDGQQAGQHPRAPDRDGDHGQEQRRPHLLHSQPLSDQPGAQRHRDGHDGEAVPQHHAGRAACHGRHLTSTERPPRRALPLASAPAPACMTSRRPARLRLPRWTAIVTPIRGGCRSRLHAAAGGGTQAAWGGNTTTRQPLRVVARPCRVCRLPRSAPGVELSPRSAVRSPSGGSCPASRERTPPATRDRRRRRSTACPWPRCRSRARARRSRPA